MKSKATHIIIFSIGALLLCYTGYRAYVLSFTMDESTTFIYYTLDSYHNIVNYVNLDANNHVLNSMATRFLANLLPLCEFTLRIHSLVAHVVFMVFSWLLLKDVKRPSLKIAAFLILNTSPYLLDFFSLARGYAMAWAFLTGSLYFFKSFLENDRRKILHVSLAFLFAALATMANFAIFHYYVALLAVFMVYGTWRAWINPIPGSSKTWFPVSLFTVACISYPALSYTLTILMRLRQNSMFVFGGDKGFLADTLYSVSENLMYKKNYAGTGTYILMVFVVVLFFAAGLFVLRQAGIKRRPMLTYQFLICLLIMTIMIISAIIFQHYFFGIKYLMDRAAIYLYIIFVFIVIYMGNYLAGAYKHGRLFLLGLASVSLLHFALSANFTHTNNWILYADNKNIMQEIGRLHRDKILVTNGKKNIKCMPYWYNYTTARFYQYLYHYQWLEISESNNPDFTEDIAIVPANDRHILGQLHCSILKTYNLSGASLAKNMEVRPIELLESKSLDMAATVLGHKELQKNFSAHNDEKASYIEMRPGLFSPSLIFGANKYLCYNNLRIKSVTLVNFIDVTKPGLFVVAVADSNDKILDWHDQKFDPTLYVSKNGWAIVPFSIDIGKLNNKAGVIKIFIWNNGSKSMLVSSIKGDILNLGSIGK